MNYRFHFLLGTIFFLLFITLGFSTINNELTGIDIAFQSAIIHLRSPLLTLIFKGVSYIVNWQSVILLCILLVTFPVTRKRLGIPVSAISFVTTILQFAFKNSFVRMRPDTSLWLIEETGYSYPSGHTLTATVLFGYIAYHLWKTLLITGHKTGRDLEKSIIPHRFQRCPQRWVSTFVFLLLIFLVGVSRIYLGVHYPTDVLGGWLLGAGLLNFYIIIIKATYARQIS